MTITQDRIRTFEALAYRDGRWWTFALPELTSRSSRPDRRITAMGQSRWKFRIAKHARDVASLWLDVPLAEVDVLVRIVDGDPLAD
jgi:hypothetical protein